MGSPLRQWGRRARALPLVDQAQTVTGMLRFEVDRRRRRRRHAVLARHRPSHPSVVEDLRRDGVAVVPGAFAREAVEAVSLELDACLAAGRPLNPAPDDAARDSSDRAEATVFLSDDDLAKGEAHCRRRTNHLSVEEPLAACPSTVPLAFAEAVIDIAQGYLGCPPVVGGSNLRKSFVNDLPDFDTLHFHCDRNSPRFLKFFLYLNDVDEQGGPFCYVTGTHRDKFRGWRAQYRWTPDEIEDRYDADRVRYLTGRVGDLIVADTTGFHRGTKARSADRSMLTIDYVVHPEFGGRTPRPKMTRQTHEDLQPRQRSAADLIEVTA